jgi:hypothetical protein
MLDVDAGYAVEESPGNIVPMLLALTMLSRASGI